MVLPWHYRGSTCHTTSGLTEVVIDNYFKLPVSVIIIEANKFPSLERLQAFNHQA